MHPCLLFSLEKVNPLGYRDVRLLRGIFWNYSELRKENNLPGGKSQSSTRMRTADSRPSLASVRPTMGDRRLGENRSGVVGE